MTENKGDLISRSALKKCAIPCEIHNGTLTELCVPLYQIDNAPTVEITEKQAILFLINSGWLVNHDKELRGKWERPQGEWKCPECGEWLFACPNCGADMRGKEE